MTPDQIREIVKITIDELTERKLINTDSYQSVLKVVDSRLSKFFNGGSDTQLARILRDLSDDPYIDVIFLQYRDSQTLERIADLFEKDVSTIKRNKKRLIMSIYELLVVEV